MSSSLCEEIKGGTVVGQYTHEPALGKFIYQEKYKWQVRHSMVYDERALHNYFLPYRKYRSQQYQCDIRATHEDIYSIEGNGFPLLWLAVFSME